MAITKKTLSPKQQDELLNILKVRFQKNENRHKSIEWSKVEAKLKANPEKLWALNEMESTRGEPDVVAPLVSETKQQKEEFLFVDCSAESPKGRRSLCYDRAALDARKEFKPQNSALDLASSMGIELLTETEYRSLQSFGTFDAKTSSWIQTPSSIRKLGGAIFADFRYGTVFVYHNGAESYYAARGFRGLLKV